jgi:transcription antitermination factor NusG
MSEDVRGQSAQFSKLVEYSPFEDSKISGNWYALQVRAARETLVAELLQGKGYNVFLPTYRPRRQRPDKGKHDRAQPLFPGYLFCRLVLKDRSVPVITTRFVQRIVRIGTTPSPISDEDLQAVQTVCESGLPYGPFPYPEPGCMVRITEGPLAGLQGTLVRLAGHDRLVISISMLRRSVAVQISADWADLISPRSMQAQQEAHRSSFNRKCLTRSDASFAASI